MINSSTISPIAYYGGTFDPIHTGHINICKSIAELFNLDNILILPNHIPPHRTQPVASSLQRIEMIKLVIKNKPFLSLDTRELERSSYSYTVETLKEIRTEKGSDAPLLFIIGEDSLYTLNKWHQWQTILDYCHLIVCKRNSIELQNCDQSLLDWIEIRTEKKHHNLLNHSSGKIYLADTPYYDISATQIRYAIKEGKDLNEFLGKEVYQYILKNSLYR